MSSPSRGHLRSSPSAESPKLSRCDSQLDLTIFILSGEGQRAIVVVAAAVWANANICLCIVIIVPIITPSTPLSRDNFPPGDCHRRLSSLPCRDPEIPHNWTHCPPSLRCNQSLTAAPCRPLPSSPLPPRPPFPPPYLEADFCIVVVVASWIDVVIVIASPPLSTSRSSRGCR
jgi:hypothetical protein